MQNNYSTLYDALLDGIKSASPVSVQRKCKRWAMVETADNAGLSMHFESMSEISIQHARINAFYNRPGQYYEPFENFCASGIDFIGKTVGVIGHMGRVLEYYGKDAKKIYVFDMEPKDANDLPIEKEDELLPDCDIVIATGSSLINRTLPHILELSYKAYFILVGPSVPMCPALLDFGIDRLSGMAISDIDGMRQCVLNDVGGSPYRYGTPFLIKK